MDLQKSRNHVQFNGTGNTAPGGRVSVEYLRSIPSKINSTNRNRRICLGDVGFMNKVQRIRYYTKYKVRKQYDERRLEEEE